MGGGVPTPRTIQLEGLGEHLSHWGPGQSPSQKWILCIFGVRKKPSGIWITFLSEGRVSPMLTLG